MTNLIYNVPEELYKFPSELGISLPVLVLATSGRNLDAFNSKREWQYINHQVGGIGCEQFYSTGTILTPTEHVANGMKKMSKFWQSKNLCTNGGDEQMMIPLEQLFIYQRQLQDVLSVDCRHTYRDFRSGLYPIDFSPENLRKLCTDDLPQEMYGEEIIGSVMKEGDLTNPKWISALSDFFLTEKKERELSDYVFNWQLFILGNNYRS